MGYKTDNKIIEEQNKNKLRKLEQFYVDSTLDNLDKVVEERRKEIVDKIVKFQEEKPDGSMNPIIIYNYFLKSINPLSNMQPKYSSEKLALVWDLYSDVLFEVNTKIGLLAPTITSFCKFAGITRSTFKSYENSADETMRTIIEKIKDECFDTQLTLAQDDLKKERTTVFRMKAENEVTEKPNVNINISAKADYDIDEINKRIKELNSFNSKKKVIEGDFVVQE